MLRLAAVGFRHGHNWSLVQHLVATGQAQVVAAVEDHPDLAARARKEYNVPVYDTVETMLAGTTVDAASLAPLNSRKAEIVAALLAGGVHCFVDKPLTTTLAGLERIKAAARASGKACIMALPVRFSGAHWTARRLITEGTIGRVAQVFAVRSHNLHPDRRQSWELNIAENGGPLIDLGSHDYDYVSWCLQDRPVAVSGNRTLARYTDLPAFADAAQMLVRFAGGASACICSDWLTPDGAKGSASSMLFVGTKGTLRILEQENQVWHLGENADWRQVPNDADVPDLYRDFLAAAEGRPHVVTTEESIEAARVLLEGWRAALSGVTVQL